MTKVVAKDQSVRRSRLASDTSRGEKATAGRTTTTRSPVHIRALGLEADLALRDYIRERLGLKLGKFALEVRRISVRLVDDSGPKGAPSRVCRVKVMLDPTRAATRARTPRLSWRRLADPLVQGSAAREVMHAETD
jgi:hypothetical protein